MEYLNSLDRRSFFKAGFGCIACASLPGFVTKSNFDHPGNLNFQDNEITSKIRKSILFAGIRKPIKKRSDLEPRIQLLKEKCGEKINGPLTHIFRYDTPVDGFDSEIGFPVSEEVNSGEIKTHMLREMHFYSLVQNGPIDNIARTSGRLYGYMNRTGLSPELEQVEVYHNYDMQDQDNMKIEVMASYLAWPGVYKEQLVRVLSKNAVDEIWSGGENINPHTPVNERCEWVAGSISRLKSHTNEAQQFDILSRVALVRPLEDVDYYKKVYDETGDPFAVIKAQEEKLKKTRTGGFLDPMRFDGKTLHLSKVPYNRKAYDEAANHTELRKAYCFCTLIREATNPNVDPIFCYRAAGWSRQFWEPIMGIEFKTCKITDSILKGDGFCAWDYYL